MVEVLLTDVIIAIALIFIVVLLLDARFNISSGGDDVHERIDELFNALNQIAAVMQHLPDMMPSFELHQNPLVNALVDWLKEGRAEPMPSIMHHELEQPDGERGNEEREG